MLYVFYLTFVAGLMLRISVIGWMLIIFGWLELILRGIYFFYGRRLARSGQGTSLLIAGQTLYLALSFFAVDFADTHSYCCIHMVRNPPEWLMNVWFFGWVVLVVVIFLFYRLSRVPRVK